ncbi:hypothetical protein HZB93_03090 [Candidatus Falkowbacteria bacterium]|nr:hypothetical protein [Candidatus Falkowbacteria bacterium]
MKVVAGCDGQLAKKIAEELRAAWPVNASQAHAIARKSGFGCANCLVVVTESGIVLCGENWDLPAIYRETFQQPDFNPRWRDGSVDFLEIVDLCKVDASK